MKRSLLTHDQYRTARGGYARLLDVRCRKCHAMVVLYQKDGPGNLRRLYFDRIKSPAALSGLEKKKLTRIGNLACAHCGELLGIPIVYAKEHRKAYRLFQDAVVKSIHKP